MRGHLLRGDISRDCDLLRTRGHLQSQQTLFQPTMPITTERTGDKGLQIPMQSLPSALPCQGGMSSKTTDHSWPTSLQLRLGSLQFSPHAASVPVVKPLIASQPQALPQGTAPGAESCQGSQLSDKSALPPPLQLRR